MKQAKGSCENTYNLQAFYFWFWVAGYHSFMCCPGTGVGKFQFCGETIIHSMPTIYIAMFLFIEDTHLFMFSRDRILKRVSRSIKQEVLPIQ